MFFVLKIFFHGFVPPLDLEAPRNIALGAVENGNGDLEFQ
jgi:hypothetical protein